MGTEENKKSEPASPGASRLEDGGPAFPTLNSMEPGDYGRFIANTAGGLSLRDYFAAKAMQGEFSALADPDVKSMGDYSHIARRAYLMADAMIAARRTA